MSKRHLWVDDSGILHSDGATPLRVELLPEATTSPVIAPWSVIRHTQSGSPLTRWEQLRTYWARKEIVIEAHCIVEMSGLLVQVMPFTRRADCNAKANSWYEGGQLRGAISYETQDLGGATVNTTPWTEAQLETIAQLDAALADKYKIPVRRPLAWNDRGMDGHYRFKEWSIYTGKTCPGYARRDQFPRLEARVLELLLPEPVPQKPDVEPTPPTPTPEPTPPTPIPIPEGANMKNLEVIQFAFGDSRSGLFLADGAEVRWIFNVDEGGVTYNIAQAWLDALGQTAPRVVSSLIARQMDLVGQYPDTPGFLTAGQLAFRTTKP